MRHGALGVPIGIACFENEWLARRRPRLSAELALRLVSSDLCAPTRRTLRHTSPLKPLVVLFFTSRSCQTRPFARTLDAALHAAYKFINHVDFLDPDDGHERNAKGSAFVRDWFCLRISQSGGGFCPYLQRFNFLNTISNVMPQIIDRTDFHLNSIDAVRLAPMKNHV